ncbi:MAG: glutathione peroxidase, partial [Myxococcota bacterium]
PDADGNEDIAWNFTKFLVGRDGSVLERFGPQVTPEVIEEVIVGHL